MELVAIVCRKKVNCALNRDLMGVKKTGCNSLVDLLAVRVESSGAEAWRYLKPVGVIRRDAGCEGSGGPGVGGGGTGWVHNTVPCGLEGDATSSHNGDIIGTRPIC